MGLKVGRRGQKNSTRWLAREGRYLESEGGTIGVSHSKWQSDAMMSLYRREGEGPSGRRRKRGSQSPRKSTRTAHVAIRYSRDSPGGKMHALERGTWIRGCRPKGKEKLTARDERQRGSILWGRLAKQGKLGGLNITRSSDSRSGRGREGIIGTGLGGRGENYSSPDRCPLSQGGGKEGKYWGA